MSGRLPLALTVAGSDCGGGAGIQADLKTFQELGVYGMSAVTAVTAQNSLGVQAVWPVPAARVEAQLDSVLSDIGADAVKTGMLPEADTVDRVAYVCRRYGVTRLVVDPVLAATDGTALSGGQAAEALREHLLPLAEVVTPNVPEACALLGLRAADIRTDGDMERVARELLRLGSRHVLFKGGHWEGREAADVLVGRGGGERPLWLRAPRLETPHTHGTGCTLSAAVAAGLARGLEMPEACRLAKSFLTAAIRGAMPLGRGTGSLRHAAWRESGS